MRNFVGLTLFLSLLIFSTNVFSGDVGEGEKKICG